MRENSCLVAVLVYVRSSTALERRGLQGLKSHGIPGKARTRVVQSALQSGDKM